MRRALSMAIVLASGCLIDPDQVPPPAPVGLTYTMPTPSYLRGQPISNNEPSRRDGGPPDSYDILPVLPAGLELNATSGIISGTPAVLSQATSYTVTATNRGGSATAQLTIAVVDGSLPPSGLAYSENPATYTKGHAITPNVPSSDGGTVESYGVSPSLPAGLSLDTMTGVISGTPTVITPEATYTVTATNTGGSAPETLSITVNDESPTGLSYSPNPATYTRGQAITPNVPTGSGGTIVMYSVSPSLPAGLTINQSTGVISGTPAALSPSASYTVTGTNSGGSVPATLTITVNDVAPSMLTYSANPASYPRGQPIQNNVPSSNGGPVVTYSITPSLPAGLAFSTSTGIISGTPTAGSPATVYTVTATNSGGSTPALLTIAVTTGIESIAAGFRHTCVVVNGGARCWGDNALGQLGDFQDGGALAHVQVFGFSSGGQAVAAGAYHSCAIVAGGVRCWGDNSYGQLGNNSYSSATRPVQVSGILSGAGVIAAGSNNSCAVVDGGARCWGDNEYGQLGNGLDAGSPIPVQVNGLTSAVQTIAVGGIHTCAVVNGGARCWGDNSYGQLGDDSFVGKFGPVQVVGLTSGVQAIATGCNHTCAIVNGSIMCWGDNTDGQLGDSTNNGTPRPVQVTGLTSGAQAIAAGCLHTCAIVNGSARCWGRGASGQLGNNSTASSSTSVQASGLTLDTQLIGSGFYHTCATQDGGLRCWGLNNVGQLGNGLTSNSPVPVPVVP